MSIIIHRNRILAKGFKEDDFEEFVKKNTVYSRKITFGYEELWTAMAEVRHEVEIYYTFPRNITPGFLKAYLEPNEREVVKQPDFYVPAGRSDIRMKKGAKPRSSLQAELLDFLGGKAEFANTKDKPRKAMFVDTGEGKTFITISHICDEGHRAAIICPDDRAITTWLEEFEAFTDLDPTSEVALLKGRETAEKIIKNKDQYKLLICSAPTLSSMFKSKDEDLVRRVFEEMEISLKVIDEMHLKLQTIFQLEMHVVTKNTIYMTATDKRRIQKEQQILESMMPPDDCVYRQGKVEKFDFVEVQYYSNATKEHQKGINKPNGFDALVYLKMLTNKEWPYFDWFCQNVLRKSVKYALKKRTDPKNKIAIVVKTNDAGDALGKYIEQEFPDVSVGYFNSRIPDMETRMKETDKTIIISTDKSLSGIINILSLEVMINVTPITSEAHLLQIAGRLRKEGDKRRIFMQLADFTFKKCRNMMYRERKILDEVSLSYTKFVVGKPSRNVEEDDGSE